MKPKLAALALVLAAGGSSLAQTPPAPDQVLCEGVVSILGKAGPNGWELSTNPDLAFDGGSAKCTSKPALKKMECSFASLKVCNDKQPTALEMVAAQRVFVYAQTRGAPALAACLKGRSAKPYGGKTEFDGYVSVTAGDEYKDAGKPTVRFLRNQANAIDGASRCQQSAIWMEFVVE